MKLVTLLNQLNDHYDDGYLANYYDQETGAKKKGEGDTFAEFVVIEVSETFDENAEDEEQIEEACTVLESARRQLEDLVNGLRFPERQ
jgi:hypothetical protein